MENTDRKGVVRKRRNKKENKKVKQEEEWFMKERGGK